MVEEEREVNVKAPNSKKVVIPALKPAFPVQIDEIKRLARYPPREVRVCKEFLKSRNVEKIGDLNRRQAIVLIRILNQKIAIYKLPCGKKVRISRGYYYYCETCNDFFLTACSNLCPLKIDPHRCDVKELRE